MKRSLRWLVPLLGVAAVGVLFVLLRPNEEASTAPSQLDSSTTPSEASSSTPGKAIEPTGSASPAASPSPEPESPSIVVEVLSGEVEGPDELEVQQGSRVVIEVSADVSDEVHVHGYDVSADVAPGRPARLVFRADAPGVYEVELEDVGLPLFELRVVP
ncbi:MAG: hypothetical protein ACRDGW_07930 [Actinomycetota bacterium]